MIDAKLLDKCRQLRAAVAPEMPEPYLFENHDLPLPTIGCALAWTRRNGNPVVRRALIKRGLWEGPKPFIILNPKPIGYIAENYGIPLSKMVQTVFAHELCHNLPYRQLPDVEPSSGEVAAATLALFQAERATTYRFEGEPPWAGHEATFTRIACHVFFRSMSGRFSIDVDHLAAGPRYGLSPLSRYLRCLHDEHDRFAGATFEEIESVDPPAEFTALWRRDTAWFTEGEEN